MLDIAIGISLVFALFAGLVSGVGEIIAQLLERRGKVLREGISSLVGELKESRAGSTLVSSLYDHPLIKTLSQPGSQPSYIPASNFAAAFVQVLSGGSLATLRQKLDDRDSDLGKLFGPMLDEANGSIDAFKARVESQFDAVMDRVGGWYKRRSQAILAVIGLVLAVALNVDVLNILDRLDKDPKLASQLSEAAASLTDARVQAAAGDAPAGDVLKAEVRSLQAQADRIETLGVPIGWQWGACPDPVKEWFADCPTLLEGQTRSAAIFGWLLAAIAATLGAPFWFDAISQLFALRGTGKKPEESEATARTAASRATAPSATVAVANGEPAADGPRNDFEATRLTGDDIEALQQALGLPSARADGVIREELRAALREWQRIKSQLPTGLFDEATVMSLLYPN